MITGMRRLTLTSSLLALAAAAQAGPQGGRVTAGAAQISRSGAETVIRQTSPVADISWDRFDVAPNEGVTFRQPSASSIALNRIAGSAPSRIDGRLSANGQVWLQNPAGVLFGPSARVDVGGLLATSSALPDGAVPGRRARFGGEGGGPVGNAGLVEAGAGGVAFVAPVVENDGAITARGGDVTLHAGAAFSVDFHGDGLLSLVVEPEAPLATSLRNAGSVTAEGGVVTLSAAAADAARHSVVSIGGLAEATGVAEVGGEIVILGGHAEISGDLIARKGERGGAVTVDARRIALTETARIDVSGDAGGGTVTLAPRTSPRPAERVVTARGSRIAADGTGAGDGGAVLLWSTEATLFSGAVSAAARGGGDGGFVDISSAGLLGFDGAADLSSADGARGLLLFDPERIVIQNVSSAEDDALISDQGTIAFSDLSLSQEQDIFLSITALEQVNGDISLQATQSIEVGDVDDAITLGDRSLTLETLDPTGQIAIFADISIGAGAVNLGTATANVFGDITIDAGDVTIDAATANVFGDITINAGDVAINASLAAVFGDIAVDAGDVRIVAEVAFVGDPNGSLAPFDAGSIAVRSGDIDIDAGAVTVSRSLAVEESGQIAVTGEASVFIDAHAAVSAPRITLQTTGAPSEGQSRVEQAFLLGPTGDGEIRSFGEGADDGVFITGGSILLAGRVESATSVSLTATGGGEPLSGDLPNGAVFISPFPDGVTSVSGFSVEQPLGVEAGIEAPREITISAAGPVAISRRIAGQGPLAEELEGRLSIEGRGDLDIAPVAPILGGTADNPEIVIDAFDVDIGGTLTLEGGVVEVVELDWIAQDYAIGDDVFADQMRIAFADSGSLGSFEGVRSGPLLDADELDRLFVRDIVLAADTNLTTGFFAGTGDPDFDPVENVTLTAGNVLTVEGDILAATFFEGDVAVPFNLNFGEPDGVRPSALIVRGRIGSTDDFNLPSPVSAPPVDLGFYVDGSVLIDPDPQVAFGDTILAATGLTTIDITGAFFQSNTLDPETAVLAELVDGEGGAGAELGAVLVLNAQSVTLFGSIGGLTGARAIEGVTFDAGVDPATIRVNDCTTVGCFTGVSVDSGFIETDADRPSATINLLVDAVGPEDLRLLTLNGVAVAVEGETVIAGPEGGFFVARSNGDVFFDPDGAIVGEEEGFSSFSVTFTAGGSESPVAEGVLFVEVFGAVEPVEPGEPGEPGEPPVLVGAREERQFLTGVVTPRELEEGAAAPDPDVVFGVFTDLTFLERDTAAEQPVSNRGNEEEWPR